MILKMCPDSGLRKLLSTAANDKYNVPIPCILLKGLENEIIIIINMR
jgi:hypothetical protein